MTSIRLRQNLNTRPWFVKVQNSNHRSLMLVTCHVRSALCTLLKSHDPVYCTYLFPIEGVLTFVLPQKSQFEFSHFLKLVKFKGHKMGLLSSRPAFKLGLVIQKLTENSQICPIYRSLHTLELHYIHKRGRKLVKHLVLGRFTILTIYI